MQPNLHKLLKMIITRLIFVLNIFLLVNSLSVKSIIHNFFNPGHHRGNIAEQYDDGYTFAKYSPFEPLALPHTKPKPKPKATTEAPKTRETTTEGPTKTTTTEDPATTAS